MKIDSDTDRIRGRSPSDVIERLLDKLFKRDEASFQCKVRSLSSTQG